MTWSRPVVVVLAGNPNTGKTTLFNALAGLRQRVGNYPGVTVEVKKGRCRQGECLLELVDLPGTYSLAARSPDELLAVNLVLGRQPGEPPPDVLLIIVDAANLERNLYLASQLLEVGRPVVVALNMVDVAQRQGLVLDAAQLAGRLGVPVIPTQAHKRKGVRELRQALAAAVHAPPPTCRPCFPEPFEQEVQALRSRLGPDWPDFLLRRLLLDVEGSIEQQAVAEGGADLAQVLAQARQRLAQAGYPVPAIEARIRYGWIRQLTADCLRRPRERPPSWTDRLDRILTHRVYGLLIFLVLMLVLFQALFTWARPFMEAIKAGQDWLADFLGRDEVLSPGPFRSLLCDGVLKGIGSVLVFLPQILILFGFLALLEDCGYLARAAFLMDKLMSRCGLSGKSFIPLLSSLACAVPGILATRVIEHRRDRLATLLVAPLMSCSARLPVYTVLIGAFLTPEQGYPWWLPGLTLFGLYALGLVLAPLVALALKRTLLRGPTPTFVLEMPLYKWPAPATVLHRMWEAGWLFVRRAGTLILATMILVWAALYFPATSPEGVNYDEQLQQWKAQLRQLRQQQTEWAAQLPAQPAPFPDSGPRAARQTQLDRLQEQIEQLQAQSHALRQAWIRQSFLGRAGRALAPVVRPLGWDWRIGMAALASFPAREVFVGTIGVIYSQGEGEADDPEFRQGLQEALRRQTWEDAPELPVFRVPVVLSVLVFFALCCQCASTLAVIQRETQSWRWPIFTFTYMTTLAYLGALLVYQVGSWLS